MSDVVIKVENLWKQYRYGIISHRTLHKDLQSWWARRRGKEDPNSRIGMEQSAKSKAQNSNSQGRNAMRSAPCSMQSVGDALPDVYPVESESNSTGALYAMPDTDRFYALQDINFELSSV